MTTTVKTRALPAMRSKILVVDADEEKNYHVDDYLCGYLLASLCV